MSDYLDEDEKPKSRLVSSNYQFCINECLFLKKVDSIFTLKINNSISVRNPLTLLPA